MHTQTNCVSLWWLIPEPFTWKVCPQCCFPVLPRSTCGLGTGDDERRSAAGWSTGDTDFSISAVVTTWIYFSVMLMVVNRLWFAGHCFGWCSDYNPFLPQTFLILMFHMHRSPFEDNWSLLATMCLHCLALQVFYSGQCCEMIFYILWRCLPPYIYKRTQLAP